MQKQKRNDNKMVRTTVSLPYWLHKRLKLQAVDVGTSFSDIVVEEIEKARIVKKSGSGREDYLKKLEGVKGKWFTDSDYVDYKNIREDLKKRERRLYG